MSIFDLVGNSLTISAVTNAANTVYYQPSYTVYPAVGGMQVRYEENAPIPDSAEAWLRRRVKEVCELARVA